VEDHVLEIVGSDPESGLKMGDFVLETPCFPSFYLIRRSTGRHPAMNEDLTGKEIWVEMDEDKSATRFSPRKGVVVRVFASPPEVQMVVVKLMPPAFRFFPLPHRMMHIVLRYRYPEKENLERTFRKGNSYAEVLELKHKRAVETDSLSNGDVAHLGAALVFSWPKPSNAESNKMIGSSRPASS